MKTFKRGDLVTILNKTRGVNLNHVYSDGFTWRKGDTAVVVCNYGHSYGLKPVPSVGKNYGDRSEKYGKDEYGTFNAEDLKLAKETKTKYEYAKPLYVKDLREQHSTGNLPTSVESTDFIKKMFKLGYVINEEVTINNEFCEYIEQHPCFVKWLIENKFITEEKFQPFEITIPIDSVDAYWNLYHRLNAVYFVFRKYCPDELDGEFKPTAGIVSLWNAVDAYKDKVKI